MSLQARRQAVAELVALGFVLLLAALLALRGADSGLTYDEGVYLLSVLDLQGGQTLGTDVFAPQPPLFYELVRFSSWVFGPDVPDVRKGIIVVCLGGVVGAYLLVRALVGPWAGIAAAAFVVVAPAIPLDAARVHADLPSLALTVLALGLAAERRGSRQAQQALAFSAGAVAMLAVGVKLTALIGFVPLALLLARPPIHGGRAARFLAAGLGAALIVAVVLFAYRHAIDDFWGSLVDYRRAARGTRNLVGVRQIFDILFSLRAAFTVALLLGLGLAAVRLARERSAAAAAPVVPVVVLATLGALALASYRPLHLNHIVLASVVLALLAATLIGWGAASLPRRGQALVAGLVVLLALGAYSQGWRRAGTELAPQAPGTIQLADRLAELTSAGSLVVSDNPVIAYLARRRTPGALVDTALLRFDTGSLTEAAVLDTVDRSCVRAVVAARAFGERPELLAAFAERFAKAETLSQGRIYSGRRAPCPPGADTTSP